METFAAQLGNPRLREDAHDRLRRLVFQETPSGDLAALDGFAAIVESRWTHLGARTVRSETPGGPVLVADFPGRGWGEQLPPVLLIMHADTVWPRGTIDTLVPWVREEGVIRGPGVFDMKSGILIVEIVLELLGAAGGPHVPLRLFLAPDEETGSAHSAHLLRAAVAGCAAALGFEAPHPDGRLKIGRFGSTRIQLSVTGRAAHAALDPGLGISAIDELVDQLTVLRRLVEPFAHDEQPVLLNVGSIDARGKTNVVAAHATAEIGMRFARQDQEDQLLPRIMNLDPIREGAVIELTVLSHRPAWAADSADLALGGTLFPGAPTGGTARGSADVNMLADCGIPRVDGLGPIGAGAHAVHEHVMESSIWERVASLCDAFSDEGTWTQQRP